MNASLSDAQRYRTLLYRFLVRQAAADAIAKFSGRTAFLLPLIEAQLEVREDSDKFTVVVIDQITGLQRAGVSIADILTEMRNSEELSGAFDAKLSPSTKLSNNPWAVETLNLTAQALLLKRNPALAARYQREASS